MKYILASASPRRKELMTQAGFSFEVVPSQVEETISQTRPADIVTELSAQKALEVYERLQPKDCTVIGADTIVVYRDEILGKPADEAEALDMLSLLAGRTHQVYTGVTLVRQAPSGSRPWCVRHRPAAGQRSTPSMRRRMWNSIPSTGKTFSPTSVPAILWTKPALTGSRGPLPSM